MADKTEDPGLSALPANIAALQRRRGWTDQVVADAIGVSAATWSRRKARPEDWTLQQIRRLARVFEVGLDELIAPEVTS